MTRLTPSRPYLVRAIYDWLLDNKDIPYLVVDTQIPHVNVPLDFIKEGQITLSIGPNAVQSLLIDNDAVSFMARFGGVPQNVYIPIMAIIAVVGKETNQGMVFGFEPGIPQAIKPETETEAEAEAGTDTAPAELASVEQDKLDNSSHPNPAKRSSKQSTTLRIVK